jgi:hypothetical protein
MVELVSANKRYNDAAMEPNNSGYVSNEQLSHHAPEFQNSKFLYIVFCSSFGLLMLEMLSS